MWNSFELGLSHDLLFSGQSTFSDRRLWNSACYTLLRNYCLKNKQRQTTGVKSVSIKEEKKDTFIHLNFENEFERKYRSLDRRIQNQNWSNRRICTRLTPLVKPIEYSQEFSAEKVFQLRHTSKIKNRMTEVRLAMIIFNKIAWHFVVIERNLYKVQT